jgi:hypothetical protein
MLIIIGFRAILACQASSAPPSGHVGLFWRHLLSKYFYMTKEKEYEEMLRMELKEKQILQLKRSLDRIYKLRNEILELASESGKATILRSKVAEVLLLLGSIAGYASPKSEKLNTFLREANLQFVGMEIESSPWPAIEHEIQLFCQYINSIAFHFTSNGVKVLIKNPKKT